MKRFIEGVDRGQGTLFPERLEDWIAEGNPVRVIDVFVEELDLGGFRVDRWSSDTPSLSKTEIIEDVSLNRTILQFKAYHTDRVGECRLSPIRRKVDVQTPKSDFRRIASASGQRVDLAEVGGQQPLLT